ncbi:similar to Saccharomyces cerevisiae YIL073C SPO22 Meiosis-specific protein essential for chromosome synapsis, involved in completion of nuclear divisions during meiosis [Maudiozyma saulgeensis]|uniref:Similar to Saccharomyces cerevisiae YIL073C SPO22 Meiosis-specific protein essential for chromosome synapsis, involved in completion of nuclear divisions during meiosis n=1 Tax=Maudiozyma saulgeensis TaxID=1789683 RepID=A0A1X7QY17_9SACH|nr:similar to Saccharomyces cerevisiae YIL073C SPO22 Meiosis-specific protein essential for chromosome synapsis, involved in completion of nuclear divisions during meiosis [Kazachstania saulgeensis]
MSSDTILSTFETTILEFCEVAKWINSHILDLKQLTEDDLKCITNRIDALQPTAEKYETSFRKGGVTINEETLLRFENLSSILWNTVSLSLKANVSETALVKFLCKCQLFAAILLSVYNSLNEKNDVALRSFNCFTTTLKTLMGEFKQNPDTIIDSQDTLFKVSMAHVETYVNLLTEQKYSMNKKDTSFFHKLLIEANICIFQWYIQQNDSDTAKIYLKKVDLSNLVDDIKVEMVLEVSRILYNSSLFLYNSKGTINVDVLDDVLIYLAKAFEYLTLPIEKIKSHIDFLAIRYSITILLIQCSIEKPNISPKEEEQVGNLFELLQKQYPKKPIPFQLQVKYLKKTRPENMTELIASIIMQMILSIDIPNSYEILISTINEFSQIDTKRALTSLDYLFQNKIDPIKDQKHFEQTILTRFYITLQSKDLNETEIITQLFDFYKVMEKRISQPLSRSTVSSIVTLLWSSGKKIEKMESYVICSKFYELALEEIISGSYSERGKLQRALTSAYLSSNNLTKAEETLNNLSPTDLNHPLTILIKLKLLLKLKDFSNIPKCFESLFRSSHEKSFDAFILALNEVNELPKLLIDGVTLFFQKLNNINDNLEKFNTKTYDVSVISLIRYTIQCVIKFTEEAQGALNIDSPKILMLLSEPLRFLRELKTNKKLSISIDDSLTNTVDFTLTADDIEWFASTAYNISGTLCQDDEKLKESFEFAKTANGFLELIPYSDFTFLKMYHFSYWGYRCRFQKASIRCRLIEKGDGQDINIFGDPKNMAHNHELDNLIHDIISFFKTATANRSLNAEQTSDLQVLLAECFKTYVNILIIQRKMDLVENLLSIGHTENLFNLDNHFAEALIQKDDVPLDIRRPIIIKLIKRNLENAEGMIDKLCYWIRCTFTDCNLKFSSDVYSIFECLLTKLKVNNDLAFENSQEVKIDIENISSICWNVGINSLISDSREDFIKWAKLAYGFTKFTRIGLDIQMRRLWNSLLSTGQIENSDELSKLFDESV